MKVPRLLAFFARPICLVIGHRRSDRIVVGPDHYLGHCKLCRRDLVKRSREEPWRLPTAGKRVVWGEDEGR
jgi:hypothetical protein